MGALTKRRWGADVTPWHELEAFGNRVGRWFDEPSLFASSPVLSPVFTSPFFTEAGWSPAVELVEAEGEFVLTAEIPGMAKEDVQVSIEDDVLTLKGEKTLEREEKAERSYIRERGYGAFERCFALPRNIDSEKIRAEYRDGVIEVHMPKSQEAKGRLIDIA